MSVGKYAVIKKGDIVVVNTIVADKSFTMKGYDLIIFFGDTLCQAGMYYSVNDGLFYDDEAFTLIGGEPVL